MTSKNCKHAFIIGIDGAMGSAVRDANTPNIDAFISTGLFTYDAQTVCPTASFQAWGAMFHGVGPEKHQIDGDHPCAEDVPWPSFAKLLCQQRPGSRFASFSCWEPINSKIIEPSCNCHCISLPDRELVPAAIDYIRQSPPDLFFMQLDDIDGAGHRHGYGTQAYLKQIEATDIHVGAMLTAIRDAGIFDESLIILLSDHGGVDRSHGSDHPDCTTIFWACGGPGIAQGVEFEQTLSIADTAPIVAHALGLTPPEGWDASLPGGIFRD